MCRVQRDTVSYSSATCHLYLGHFSSLCQYSVLWLLSLPRPSQYRRRGAVHLGTGPAAGPVALWGHPGSVTAMGRPRVCPGARAVAQLPAPSLPLHHNCRLLSPCPSPAPAPRQRRRRCQQHQLATTFLSAAAYQESSHRHSHSSSEL